MDCLAGGRGSLRPVSPVAVLLGVLLAIGASAGAPTSAGAGTVGSEPDATDSSKARPFFRDATFDATTSSWISTDQENELFVHFDGTHYVFKDVHEITPTGDCVQGATNFEAKCPVSEVTVQNLFLDLRGGDDLLWAKGMPAGHGIEALGGEGDDRVTGGRWHDRLFGGPTRWDADRLDGFTGDDRLEGEAGRDFMNGGPGNDLVRGGDDREFDHVTGGEGDDRLDGGPGPDTYHGAYGNDTVSYASRTAPVTVTLADRCCDGSQDNKDGNAQDSDAAEPGRRDVVDHTVENVIGGRASDTLVGNRFPNVLVGGVGADVLRGQGASDWLRARDQTRDRALDCGGGASDRANLDFGDLAPSSCERVRRG